MLSFFPDDAFYQPSKCWQVDLHRDSRSRYLWLKLEEAYGQSHPSPQAWVTKVLLSACSTQVKSKVPKSLMSSHINCFLDSKISYWKVFLCCALFDCLKRSDLWVAIHSGKGGNGYLLPPTSICNGVLQWGLKELTKALCKVSESEDITSHSQSLEICHSITVCCAFTICWALQRRSKWSHLERGHSFYPQGAYNLRNKTYKDVGGEN